MYKKFLANRRLLEPASKGRNITCKLAIHQCSGAHGLFNDTVSTTRLFRVDEIGDSEMVFGEMRPRIRHRLPGIHLTVGENLGKNPTSLEITEEAEKIAVVNSDSKVTLDTLQNRNKHNPITENIRKELKKLERQQWTVLFRSWLHKIVPSQVQDFSSTNMPLQTTRRIDNNHIILRCAQDERRILMYTDGMTHNQIDHILIDKRRHTFRETNCNSEHYLVIGELRERLSVAKRVEQQANISRSNILKLKDEETKQRYQVEISNRFAALATSDDTEEELDLSRACIGYHETKKKKPWFDEDCSTVVDRRKQAKLKFLQDPIEENRDNYFNKRQGTSRTLRNKKRDYLKEKLNEVETNSTVSKNKNIEIYIRPNRKYQDEIQIQTAEPFIPEPTLSEVEIAIENLKKYKSPGIDQIPAELIQEGGRALTSEIYKLVLEYAIRKVQDNREGLELNRLHQLLVYMDDMNMLGENSQTIKENTEILLEASKAIGLEVNPEKTNLLSKNLKVRIYKTVILPVVLYGCETWTLTLREEQRLRVFKNKVLRKIFEAKRDEVTGEWRKLHNTELHALYSSPDIIRNIKSRRLRWAGHVARMGESRNAYRVLVGRPEGKRPLGRPRRRWEDIIKMDLRERSAEDALFSIKIFLGHCYPLSDFLAAVQVTAYSTPQLFEDVHLLYCLI
ncbi:hypothetical protein ANN_04063 [Periplaneta americana]|uniref:Reverse transcriptase domain-containing protein n=1 Tax=Periplaneta americana TaxID=6978 RepID=A0ABQ8T9C5_PERAM|nr:hypothetical protein ANN_04063 [Periplaneta americana]